MDFTDSEQSGTSILIEMKSGRKLSLDVLVKNVSVASTVANS